MSDAPRYTHLRTTDYRVMPWKNGGGTTTEVAVYPAGAGLESFEWRVSVADVGASGPFSTFPGCDRVIVQTDGTPMALSHAGRGEHRLSLLEPYAFDGDWATEGTLEAAAVRDFNVIARRGAARAALTVVHGPGHHVVAASPRVLLLVHALRGDCSVEVGESPVRLETGESVVTDEGAGLRAVVENEAIALVVRVERLALASRAHADHAHARR